MTGPDFDHFCRLVRERSGLVLSAEKAYLVTSRLQPIARAEGLAGPLELLERLRTSPQETMIRRCVDAMATHESSFFRDGAPFEQLARDVLPVLVAARSTRRALRIWCAACSSGQEPYTIAMVLKEFGAQLSGWRLEIIATDMSEAILEKAKLGVYSDFEVKRGLTLERRDRWFTPHPSGWQVAPALKSIVQFRPHNLLQGAASMGTFDIVLCRNVLIYFDVNRKRQILGALSQALAPDGALYLGSAETVLGVSTAFVSSQGARGLYRHAPKQAAQSA